MKEWINNRSIWQKVVIIVVFAMIILFLLSGRVQAGIFDWTTSLIDPIFSFLVYMADGFMDLLGNIILGETRSLYTIDFGKDIGEWILIFLGAVGAAILVAAAVVISGGLAAGGLLAAIAVVGKAVVYSVAAGALVGLFLSEAVYPSDKIVLPVYTYSIEEIIKGNILIFNVDFFNGTDIEILEKKDDNENIEYYYYIDDEGNEVRTSSQNSAQMLQGIISTWYKTLRNIAIVLMLSVLLYIGIRMLLSSVASDKARYKELLKDWFIGICLLFLMHYIMAFSVALVNKLIDIVGTSVDSNSGNYVLYFDKSEIIQYAKDNNLQGYIIENDGQEAVAWPTNLMGYLRVLLQLENGGVVDVDANGNETIPDSEASMIHIGYAIMFITLCIFTVMFTFIYFKRLLYMVFLTMIAPLVALTYCIDKVTDGQAQGFNMWLKEYIFNLLIQPMHLLLYYMLITSAFELAGQNIIYSLVAIGFMLPAEKLLRKLFGFQKSETSDMMGPVGAMATMQAFNKGISALRGRGRKNSIKSSGESLNTGDNENSGKFPFMSSRASLSDSSVASTYASFIGKENKDASGDNLNVGKKSEINSNDTTPIGARNTTPISNNISKKRRIGRAILSGSGYLAKKGLKSGGKLVAKGIANSPRYMAAIASGVASLGVGTAAVMATGDPIKMGIAAAGAAGVIGAVNKNLKDFNPEIIKPETVEAFQKGLYGDRFDEIQRNREYMKQADSIKSDLEDSLGKDSVKGLYDNNGQGIKEYMKRGFTKAEDVVIGEQLKSDGVIQDLDQYQLFDEHLRESYKGENPKYLNNKKLSESREVVNRNVKTFVKDEKTANKVSEQIEKGVQAIHDARENLKRK